MPAIARLRLSLQILVVLALATSPALAADGDRLLLYPDIHRDFVVFVHGEDLWRASIDGGEARRLTSHDGQELFPKISPDGEWIAFTAEYSGARQVWIIPSVGGTPRQLTFYTDVGTMPPRGGSDAWVLGWTPDGKILVRMNRTPWGQRMGRYFLVDPAGGLESPLPIPHGGTASFSDDGTQFAYTPIDREFRTWKRSLGGRAQDIWIYDLEANASRRVTEFRGTDNFPMWSGDTLYFVSDRDYTANLFALPAVGGEARRVTDHDVWDVLWPSLGPEAIVYVAGGDLHRFDLGSQEVQTLDIEVRGDRAASVPHFDEIANNVSGATLSPSGARMLFSGRGELVTVPAERGSPRVLTRTPGTREHSPAWSPDGKWIAYLSDATGEYEVYLRRADGTGTPRQLTSDGRPWTYTPIWSGDSKRLAFADRSRRLWVMDVEGGAPVEVDRGFRGDIRAYRFSPDGRWLVFENVRDDTRLVGLSLFDVDEQTLHRLGDGLTNDYQPAWSADGRSLFFVSDRDFNLRFSGFEFNYIYDNPSRVYVATLDPEAGAFFEPRSDEETSAEDSDESDDGSNAKDEAANGKSDDASEAVTIDPALFESRIEVFPGLDPANYSQLAANDSGLFLLETGDSVARLHRYDLEERKAEKVAGGVLGYELSANGEKILYLSRQQNYHVIAARAGAGEGGAGRLDLSGVRLKIEPEAEWRQIFDDAWRLTRDYFYDPNMHGMDWQAIGDRYRELVPRIAHRSELDFILGEMISELGAGHLYVQSGEMERQPRVVGGKLGAELAADPSGFYRIERILSGENWTADSRSPFEQPGVDVEEGDFLISIDGEPLTTDDNPYRLLEGKANALVTLEVSDRPQSEGAREVIVRTIGSETNLRYIDWVKSRLALVDRLSDGKVGYIHLPNTAFAGNRMLQKLFYSQSNKDALIVDDRYNGGGFIPDRMIEMLERTPLARWAMRDIDAMRTPGFAHDGPKVMLMNGYSSSGGDALPYFFRKKGLGKLIGTRTWGGLIGLNGNPGFLDGGSLAIPTFRIYDETGAWIIENEGVEPDLEVFDVAERFDETGDPSIETAVDLLLEDLAASPRAMVEPPAAPNLSREALGGRLQAP
ncbi:MAG: PDZ domain-containing protein [Acidobacteriota bacterium]